MTAQVNANPIHAYAVEHDIDLERGLGIVIAFVQEGSDAQLCVRLTQAMAWQIASKILGLLNADPMTPDDPNWDKI